MLMATAIAGYAFRLLAVLAHMAGGGLALLLGPWQFLTGRSGRRNVGHVWTGRFYVVAVVVGGFAGLVLAPFSMSSLTAHLGFGLLALLTLATTARALQRVLQGDIIEHRQWMIRGFALILGDCDSACTDRFSGTPLHKGYRSTWR